jgi:hypothetical protein
MPSEIKDSKAETKYNKFWLILRYNNHSASSSSFYSSFYS